MDTLPASLTSHQRGPARRPAASLLLADTAHGRPRFHWQHWHTATPQAIPHAATITPNNVLVRIWNDAGDIVVARTPDVGPNATTTTSTVATGATPGAGVAISSIPGNLTIAWVDNAGERIRADLSTDDGASFFFAATAATESAPISHLAMVDDGTGDLIVFYVMDGSTDVKHVRRQSFAWGSPATWTRSGDADTITGIAAAHDGGNVQLVITGSTDTAQEPTVWGVLFGDGALPANVWGGLVPIITLDPDSTSHFTAPSISIIGGTAFAAFNWHETGDVAHVRTHITHPASGDINAGNYVQPYPTPSSASHGGLLAASASLAVIAENGSFWGTTFPEPRQLEPWLLSASWRYRTDGTTAEFTLDDATGALGPLSSQLIPRPGMDLVFTPGYASGNDGALESGNVRRFRIQSVTRSFARDGRRTLTLRATGPWDAAAQWRAPIAYQIPANTLNRLQLFQLFAGLAGIPTTGSPTGWTAQEPGFALNPGESAQTALARLLAPTAAAVRHEAGSIELLDAPTTPEEDYSPTEHPIEEGHHLDESPATNWLRIHGDERYADAHDFDSLGADGPRFRVERHLSATTDALAEDYAEDALTRQTRLRPRLRLRVPYHAGQRLYDVVNVELAELAIDGDYRVVAIENRFERSAMRARYDTTLTLAAVD